LFKKVENWGCVVKSEKWGVFYVKKWTFSQRRVHYVQYQYFVFYILLIWGVRTHPTHPPCLRACIGELKTQDLKMGGGKKDEIPENGGPQKHDRLLSVQ